MVRDCALMEHPAAPLLAQDLGHLQHTNAHGERGLVCVPGFASNAGMAPEQAEAVGSLALAIAEAAIETLEDKHGYRVIHRTELRAQAEAIAAEKRPSDELTLVCSKCRRPVIKVNTANAQPKVHVGTLVADLAAHEEACR